MNKQVGGRIVVVFLACVLLGGCQGSGSRRAEALAGAMRPGMAKPTVGGPHREWPVQREQGKIVASVLRVFQGAGIELTDAWEPREGLWLLGKSMADRRVLVEVTPIVPGRFVVRVTVEGADQITKALLEDLAKRFAARFG